MLYYEILKQNFKLLILKLNNEFHFILKIGKGKDSSQSYQHDSYNDCVMLNA